MSYRIKRVDSNQPAIVKRLRKLGAKVVILSEVGRGIPDILICLPRGKKEPYTAFIEIKDGSKPPSARKLTMDEAAFRVSWPGHYEIITSEQEATDLIWKVMGLNGCA